MSTDFALCIPALRAVSLALTGHEGRAVDLVEATVLRLLGDPRPAPPAASRKVWMLTMLHNLHRHGLTKNQKPFRSIGSLTANVPPLSSSRQGELGSDEFRRAFWRLADGEREALMLEGVCGLSREEVAAICGCAPRSIDMLLSKARQKLQRLLSAARPEIGERDAASPAKLRAPRYVEAHNRTGGLAPPARATASVLACAPSCA